jgi:hypothetical protein
MTQAQGRVVLTHSTHIPGLISVLEKLVQYPSIQTITPGVICPVRAHIPHLRLRVSVPIRGGFKLIARSGKIAQEVFIVTSMGQTDLETAIGQILDPKS